MALPNKEKTWVFDYINEQISSDTLETLVDSTWLHIKNSLVGLGWTVRGSSNGTTADTSDNWDTVADLVHSSGAHSWIVLRHSTMDLEICIDLDTTVPEYFDMWVARSAYNLAAPVTTAKPTATTEWQIHSSATLCSAAAVRTITHVIGTDESPGNVTAILVYWADADYYIVECSHFIFAIPEDAPSGWTTPAIFSTKVNTANGPTAMYSTDTNNHMFVGTSKYNFYCTGECVNGTLLTYKYQGFPCDLDTDAGRLLSSIGIFSVDSGARGVNGRLPDIYWAPAHDTHGSVYDATSKTWIKLGALFLPWDGATTPRIV